MSLIDSPTTSEMTYQFLLPLVFPVLVAGLFAFIKLIFTLKSLFKLISIHRDILIQNSNRIDRIERFLQTRAKYDPGTIELIIDKLDF